MDICILKKVLHLTQNNYDTLSSRALGQAHGQQYHWWRSKVNGSILMKVDTGFFVEVFR